MSLPSLYISAAMNVQLVPFRLRVLKALSACIEGVNPDNGHHHDLRGRVFRGRLRFGSTDPLPMVSILEAPIPQESNNGSGENTSNVGGWELLVQGFAPDDRANPSDPAHHMMAEVKSVLVKEKRRSRGNDILGMHGRIIGMNVGQGSVRPPEDPSSEAFFWLTLRLQVAEDLEQPYK